MRSCCERSTRQDTVIDKFVNDEGDHFPTVTFETNNGKIITNRSSSSSAYLSSKLCVQSGAIRRLHTLRIGGHRDRPPNIPDIRMASGTKTSGRKRRWPCAAGYLQRRKNNGYALPVSAVQDIRRIAGPQYNEIESSCCRTLSRRSPRRSASGSFASIGRHTDAFCVPSANFPFGAAT